MCVCVYVCMCVIFVCVYVYMCTIKYIYVCIYMHVCMCMCSVCVCVFVYIYVCIYIYIYTYFMCTYIYVLNIPIFLCNLIEKMWLWTEKLGIKPDPVPKWFIPDPDPAKSSWSDRIRIPNTGCGSGILFIPDPIIFHPGSRIPNQNYSGSWIRIRVKEFKYLNQKYCF